LENVFSLILHVFLVTFVDWGRSYIKITKPLFSWVKSHAVWVGVGLGLDNLCIVHAIVH